MDLSFLCDKVDDNVLAEFGESFGSGLKHVTLNLIRCKKIGDVGICNLARGFGSMTNLVWLCIDCESCSQIGGMGLTSLVRELPAASIKQISFDLQNTSIAVLEDFPPAFGRLHRLRHLRLNLACCNFLDDTGLARLCEGLPPGLHNLELGFGHCGSIASLSPLIERLRELKLTKLNLCLASMGGVISSEFSSTVNALPDCLEQFSLDPSNSSWFGDSSIDELVMPPGIGFNERLGGLLRLKSLNYFDLSLRSCQSLSDNGIDGLLQGVPNIERFGLDLNDCDHLSKAAFVSILQALPKKKWRLTLHSDGDWYSLIDTLQGLSKPGPGKIGGFYADSRRLDTCFRSSY